MLAKLVAIALCVLGGATILAAPRTKRPWTLRVGGVLLVLAALWLEGERLALRVGEAFVDWNAPSFTGIDPAQRVVEFREVAAGFSAPVHVTHAPDGTGWLYVVEQWGTVRIVRDGARVEAPFCDLSAEVWAGGECGLLSLAFHPNYAENGRAFVNFTRKRAVLETVVAELTRSADPARVEPGYRELLVFTQPYTNHNGGLVAFGPDGLLYVGTGDGGAAHDPLGAGQDTGTLLGKLLRIDVDGARPYAIPPTNPFADGAGGRPEVYAWGLRNPWRFSWDPARPERLFVGGVGQDRYEEVSLVSLGDNCGWNVREGAHPFRGEGPGPFREPIHTYGHDVGYSVTGGHVLRGEALPELDGTYVFADYAPGALWGLREDEDGAWTCRVLGEHGFRLSSFGVDAAGALYACDREDGRLFLLVRAE
ncbi:MAG: PQQ-dependent sugar dehydrogenase [Planctomycetota bacterium]